MIAQMIADRAGVRWLDQLGAQTDVIEEIATFTHTRIANPLD